MLRTQVDFWRGLNTIADGLVDAVLDVFYFQYQGNPCQGMKHALARIVLSPKSLIPGRRNVMLFEV